MLIQNIYKNISKFYSLFNKTVNGDRILIYHSVDTSFKIDKNGLNNIDLLLFEDHLKEFKKYNLISITDINKKHDDLRLIITFDDGYADNLYLASPLLKKYHIPFTIFVTTDFIKNKKKYFLNSEELISLSKIQGVTIGSHTKTHPVLTQCTDLKVYNELYESKVFLEDLLQKPIETISYPFGKVDMRVRNIAEKVGYKIGCCSNFNINTSKRDRLLLNRCFVLNYDNETVINSKINGNWDWVKYRYKDPIYIK